MYQIFLKSKIHRVTVTDTQLHYDGSLTIDPQLMEKAGISEFEKVLVVNINNGHRFETYTISGKSGSGEICVNGAAAHLASKGDIIIIMSFVLLHQDEIKKHKPVNIQVSEHNTPMP